MDCKQNSKFDQVPEFNETYLLESKKQLNNDDSYLAILSNMMEKETHVGNVSSDEQTLYTLKVFFHFESWKNGTGKRISGKRKEVFKINNHGKIFFSVLKLNTNSYHV